MGKAPEYEILFLKVVLLPHCHIKIVSRVPILRASSTVLMYQCGEDSYGVMEGRIKGY